MEGIGVVESTARTVAIVVATESYINILANKVKITDEINQKQH